MTTPTWPLRITIPVDPRGWARVRTRGRKRFHEPAYAEYKKTLRTLMAIAARAAGLYHPLPLGCAVVCDVHAFFRCPPSHERKREPRPARPHTNTPDRDNVLKAVQDAGEGILWVDDKQVSDGRTRKEWAPQGVDPRLELTIYPDTLAGHGCAAVH